jgi:hypothetical protein
MANIMKQVTGTIKTVVSKAAPVAKVVGGILLVGGVIIAGVKYHHDHRKAADEETMEDLEPIDEAAEEVNE